MSAKTQYWTCGACGYENKPHVNRRTPLEKNQVDPNLKCEQCGASAENELAFDRTR